MADLPLPNSEFCAVTQFGTLSLQLSSVLLPPGVQKYNDKLRNLEPSAAENLVFLVVLKVNKETISCFVGYPH